MLLILYNVIFQFVLFCLQLYLGVIKSASILEVFSADYQPVGKMQSIDVTQKKSAAVDVDQ